MTGHVFVRPNGKPYRPRTSGLRARAWENPESYEQSAGVIVFGTLNPDEAHAFALVSAGYWFGTGEVNEPVSGWWRDGFDRGERTWVADGERGAPGVMFTWGERDTGSSAPAELGLSDGEPYSPETLCETCEHPRRRHITSSPLRVLGCVVRHCECREFRDTGSLATGLPAEGGKPTLSACPGTPHRGHTKSESPCPLPNPAVGES